MEGVKIFGWFQITESSHKCKKFFSKIGVLAHALIKCWLLKISYD